MNTLMFQNYDAIPSRTVIECSKQSVKPIMEWYGSHHAGDDYDVYINGNPVRTDRNGCYVCMMYTSK